LQPIPNYFSIQVCQSSFLKTRIIGLEIENEKLKADYSFAVNDCEEAHEAVANLKEKLKELSMLRTKVVML
jgi:hypothetical protein